MYRKIFRSKYNVLGEKEIFRPNVANSALEGNHYVNGRRAINIIVEALQKLQITSFIDYANAEKFKDLWEIIEKFSSEIKNLIINQDSICEKRKPCMTQYTIFERSFKEYRMIGCKYSECFSYWNKLIYELASILNDLTKSFQEADWNLHLSALQRAIPLCFAFDRVNYKLWLPLYYQDCLQLSQNFPGIYAQLLKGDFVVRHTSRNGSAVPIVQALEKEYNKPAKSQAGIIGFTRRKEAVCKWNIIKHEKAKYRKFLSEVCLTNKDDEYELHHEFSGTLIEKSEE